MDDDRANLTAEVAIVGFGPVGKLLAIQLGQRGHDVVVVDRQLSAYPLPRAVTHCSDFARILQSVGLAPDEIPDITQPYDDLYVWRNAARETLLAVDWSGQGESGWHNTYFFHQPSLERRLDEVIGGLESVRVLRGWDAVGVSQSASNAVLSLVSTQAAGKARVSARWVVGADGGNSSVRRWAGIDWHDEGYFYDWLVYGAARADGALDLVAGFCAGLRSPAAAVPTS